MSKEDVQVVRNVFSVILTKRLINYLYLAILLENFAHLCISLFNITPLTSVINMFGTWFNGVDKSTKDSIRIGVCAFIWEN